MLAIVKVEEEVTAQGVSWNNIVNAGQSVEFGFCAERGVQPTPPPPTPAPTPQPTPAPTPHLCQRRMPTPEPTPTPPPTCQTGLITYPTTGTPAPTMILHQQAEMLLRALLSMTTGELDTALR